MLRSMTGFGSSSADAEGAHYAVEVRSVNNKYFKAQLRIPEELAALEVAAAPDCLDVCPAWNGYPAGVHWPSSATVCAHCAYAGSCCAGRSAGAGRAGGGGSPMLPGQPGAGSAGRSPTNATDCCPAGVGSAGAAGAGADISPPNPSSGTPLAIVGAPWLCLPRIAV